MDEEGAPDDEGCAGECRLLCAVVSESWSRMEAREGAAGRQVKHGHRDQRVCSCFHADARADAVQCSSENCSRKHVVSLSRSCLSRGPGSGVERDSLDRHSASMAGKSDAKLRRNQ